MKINDLYNFLSKSTSNAIRQIQSQLNSSTFSITMKELQRTIDAVEIPTPDTTAAIQAYQDSIASLTATIQNINNLYAPILEQTRKYEDLYNSSMVAALQSRISAVEVKGFLS